MTSVVETLLRKVIRADIQSVHAYAVQPSSGMVKLDAMENPYVLEESLQRKLGDRLARLPLNRYPAANVERLRQSLSDHVKLNEGHGLMLGNGSDELIGLLTMACNRPGACVLAPEPGFVMYGMSAMQHGLDFHGVPLTPAFELDVDAMLAAMAKYRPALIYLAYPNNPTANLWSVEAVRRVIAAACGLVIIDEAYQPFSSKTWLDEMRTQPHANQHVLLLRTLSKFGLAGVRLGYLLGNRTLIAEIDKLRPPYNISVLNAEAGLFALEHAEVFAEQAESIRSERARLIAALAGLPGIKVFPSDANMILVRVPDVVKTFERLKLRKILVKNVSGMHGLLAGCLRLTVGTPAENDFLIQTMGEQA